MYEWKLYGRKHDASVFFSKLIAVKSLGYHKQLQKNIFLISLIFNVGYEHFQNEISDLLVCSFFYDRRSNEFNLSFL